MNNHFQSPQLERGSKDIVVVDCSNVAAVGSEEEYHRCCEETPFEVQLLWQSIQYKILGYYF
jgi:hypothetical protein